MMDDHAGHLPSLKIYLALNVAALLAAGALMILMAGNASRSGLRLLLIGGTFLMAALAAASAVLLRLRPENEGALQHAIFEAPLARRLPSILGILFAIFWCLTWFPPEYARGFYYYFIGLYPLILCGLLASGAGLVFLVAGVSGSSSILWSNYWRQRTLTLRVALLALAAFALLAFLIARWGILDLHEPYWYGTGVPVLASQVFLAVVIVIVALKAGSRLGPKNIPNDMLLFALIWVVTALLWAAPPVSASYWVTGPRLPNNEYYPFSDLEIFDLGSQFALIGQGIFNHIFFDRALYMSFLVYVHTLIGQNYQQVMAAQAVLFGVFPALLYLIGARLHSRLAGLIVAALAAMRGLNSLIATAWIDTATFKHMLTDFPTAIGLALFVLLMFKWREAPQPRARYILWAGGLIGLISLLRPHVLLLLPLVFLLALWTYGRSRWKQNLVLSGFTLVAFFAAIAPWMFLGTNSGSIIAFYGQRVHDVFVQRYPPRAPAPTPLPALPSWAEAPELGAAVLAAPPRSVPLQVPPPAGSHVPFPAAHYLHNLVDSVLFFPGSPEFLAVKETVKGAEKFWRPHWDGHMSPVAAAMLVLNLALIALGMGAAAQRLRWGGSLLLAVLLIYYCADSFARTSGGRYLVPADWIVLCYFSVGLAELLQMGQWLTRPPAPADRQPSPPNVPETQLSFTPTLATIASVALIGGLIPLAGVIYPPRYPAKAASEVAAQARPYLSNLSLTDADVSAFLAQPGAVAEYGRALYPRFYARGAGEPARYLPFAAVDYPRTVFILIGPHGQAFAILPGPPPALLPNASDAIVLGCESRQQGYDILSALAVVLPQQGASYARSPAVPLACPLPAPVCDNNGNCR